MQLVVLGVLFTLIMGAIGTARIFLQTARDRESTRVDKVFRPFIAVSAWIIGLIGFLIVFAILARLTPPPEY